MGANLCKSKLTAYDGRYLKYKELQLQCKRRLRENSVLKEYEKYINQSYDIHQECVLGHGATGDIVMCTNRQTGVEYALKSVKKTGVWSDVDIDVLRCEVRAALLLDHPAILRPYEVYECYDAIYIVFPICEGGELFEDLKTQCEVGRKYSESFVRRVMATLTGAVAYTHSHGIAHGDLKLENVLYESLKRNAGLVLIDFGLCRFVSDESAGRARKGSVHYASPELLSGGRATFHSDVWALGVMAYTLLAGARPFQRSTDAQAIQAILQCDFNFPVEYFDGVSEQAMAFISACLQRSPDSRPSAEGLSDHPWLSEYQEKTLADELWVEFVHNVGNYGQRKVITQIFLRTLVYVLSPEQLSGSRELFDRLDAGHRGQVHMQDIQREFQRMHFVEDTVLQSALEELQKLSKSSFSFREFAALSIRVDIIPSNCLRAAFMVLSRYSDFITPDSLQCLLGCEANKSDVEEMFREINMKIITFEEYKNMLLGPTYYQRLATVNGNMSQNCMKAAVQYEKLKGTIVELTTEEISDDT